MSFAKIILVGPCKSGKTFVSNFLAQSTTPSSGEYCPTKGVRILEYSTTTNLPQTGKAVNCDVELWDCSGDKECENCWPAMLNGAQGMVLVYSPDQYDTEEVGWYFKKFAGKAKFKDYQCLLVGNRRPTSQGKVTVPSSLSKVKHVQANIELDPDSIRTEFNEFLARIFSAIKIVQDQEELGIVGSTQ